MAGDPWSKGRQGGNEKQLPSESLAAQGTALSWKLTRLLMVNVDHYFLSCIGNILRLRSQKTLPPLRMSGASL